jgi:hypothetical protein
VVVRLLCREALLHVLYYQALKELLGLFGMLRERFVLEVEFTLNDVSNNLKLGVTREWNFATEHDVEHYAHRPNVNFLVVVLKENLWCNVIRL